MSGFIPLSVPNMKGNELEYTIKAIESEWVSTAGSLINRFEEDIQNYTKIKNAVACQSGTAGLHLALIVSEINDEHEVIVPTLTFIAAINPVKYVGASPIFMDCDDSLCMDAQKLEEFCTNECYIDNDKLINKKTKKHIKAMIVVHVFGNIANMIDIKNIAQKYNLIIIEDATESLGSYYIQGKYANRFAGSIGDIGVYSFNGNKIITTGGGGMVVSNDDTTAKKTKYLSTQAKDNELYFIHNNIGYNYRMTNIQAALGVAQLEQIEDFIKIKKKNYEMYYNELNNIDGLNILSFDSKIRPNYWFYSLYLNNFRIDRDELIKYLSSKSIQTRPIWGLIHEQLPYKSCQSYKIEKAIDYQKKIVNLPCSSNLSEEDVRTVINYIKSI